MVGDGLHEPLGTKKKVHGGSLRSWPVRALGAVFALTLAALGFLATRDDGGRGGEPFAVASIDRLPAPPAAVGPARTVAAIANERSAPPALAPEKVADQTGSTTPKQAGESVVYENGVKVVRLSGGKGSTSLMLHVPQATGLASAPDLRLIEPGAFGPLPRIGPDGARPADVYARRFDTAHDRPRIAILVGGMGLDSAETARATTSLPAAVTLAFAPDATGLDQQVKQAREAGHEVVLQLPMGEFGAEPSSSQSISTNGQGNEGRLNWYLSRFTGYAGVSTSGGGRLLGNEVLLRPLLQQLAARGLYFVDDGTGTRSLASPLASEAGLSFLRADVVLDDKPDEASVRAALRQLEWLARSHGFALGVASGRHGTNMVIGHFATDLERRGISLVSVSQGLATEPRVSAGNVPERPPGRP